MTLANMTQAETNRTNTEHCKSIAETLDKIANGELFKCPECGEFVDYHDVDEDDYIDDCTCPECGEHVALEQVSMYDWLEDALDYEFTIGSDRNFRGCRVMLTCGGPNIYANTMTGQVELYWWTDRASYPISNRACEELNAAMEEYYTCIF